MVLIGERTAEDIKIKIGSALEYEGEGRMEIKGRNLVDGLPKNIELNSEEVREAILDTIMQIIDAIRSTLLDTLRTFRQNAPSNTLVSVFP